MTGNGGEESQDGLGGVVACFSGLFNKSDSRAR